MAIALCSVALVVSGCTHINGGISAKSVPYPVLLGPVEKVGGGAIRATEVHRFTESARVVVYRRSTSAGSTESVTTTFTGREAFETFGLHVMDQGFSPLTGYADRLSSPEEPLRPGDVFRLRELYFEVQTSQTVGAYGTGDGGGEKRFIFVKIDEGAILHTGPDRATGAAPIAPAGDAR